MKKRVKSLIIVALLLIYIPSFAAWSLAPPQTVKLCSRCHGLEGKSTNPRYPKLAGQGGDYIIKQLWEFKNGYRKQPLMSTIADKLTFEEIIQLANYFSDQSPSFGFAKPGNIALGKRLYQGGDVSKGIPACSACHGPAGNGNSTAMFPRLGGQHAAYIVKQLQKFQQGERQNDPSEIMRDISRKISMDEMVAVANYISGLHD